MGVRRGGAPRTTQAAGRDGRHSAWRPDPAVIDRAQLVFDLVAVPPETSLIRYAKTGGKAVITGAEVITLQAVEQFVLSTGVRPTEEQIRRASARARPANRPGAGTARLAI